jgi:hypothetical protein
VQQLASDGVKRIISASEQQGSSTAWSRQYSYDNLGNMTQTPTPGGATTWTAGSFNSKNQVAGANWLSDNAGNVVGAGTGGPTLQYDGESRLVNVCGTSSCTTFSYDAAGNRVQRTDSSSQIYDDDDVRLRRIRESGGGFTGLRRALLQGRSTWRWTRWGRRGW